MDIIVDFILHNPGFSSPEIHRQLSESKAYTISFATLKRRLSELLEENLIQKKGRARGTKYFISNEYQLIRTIDVDEYYSSSEREILDCYNFEIIEELKSARIFTDAEMEKLIKLNQTYVFNCESLSTLEYERELERLSVDLTWKSSEIEGNTYTLLDTERLLRENKTADGKTVEEALMLLNHKKGIDFLLNNKDYFDFLRIRNIEDLHSVLMKGLNIERNIRTSAVAIGGTNYRPLDNEHQIREALQNMCDLVNKKENPFEKVFLVLLLISYVQAFNDGNKRTARIVANSILVYHGCCPISFRTVEASDYKKAMLIFYEQNNLSAFKKIFIDQYRFAVQEYFNLSSRRK